MNMAITRRDVLKTLTTGTAAAVTAGTVLSGVTLAEEQAAVPPAAVGMLYDATR